ncbi:MAG: AMP-dependent synthetase and ligase [Actinomycetia bacterium]|jgi:acyl-CoA synthetase (AMP-forming)/AMP-acid ligase II|nr:AMP-dependent synthetase and ligase [Actinomycetes bacterium]
MSLPGLPWTIAEAARRFADRTAYVTPLGWSMTYDDVDRISDEVAVGLAARGVRGGDVVGVVLPAGPEYLLTYAATAKLGAITAGVNDRLSEREREAILDVAGPRLVVSGNDAPPADSVEAVLAGLRVPGEAPPALDDDPDRPVAIIFTSGTTGLPKGALYCNRQLAFITQTDVGDTWDGGGRSFSGTSFAHLGFMTKLAGNLRRGGTTFIMERWRARPALELLAREQMTTVAGVPTQLALMLRDPGFDDFDLSSVQYIIAGGGPVTPGLADEARRRFGARLATRYSCTEAGIGLGTAFDDPDEDAIISVGRPHASVELSLRDEGGAPISGAGTVRDIGEVCLRSPAMMSRYWRDDEQTRTAFTADGFVRTGDLGWVDDRGRLRLVGRSKEMYVRGGYNVYPVEVESVLSTHPDVAAIAVVPRSDDVMGEIGVAAVVPRDRDRPPSLADLRAFASPHIAAYKLPEAMHVVEALPLTVGEKVDRRALVDEIEKLVT